MSEAISSTLIGNTRTHTATRVSFSKAKAKSSLGTFKDMTSERGGGSVWLLPHGFRGGTLRLGKGQGFDSCHLTNNAGTSRFSEQLVQSQDRGGGTKEGGGGVLINSNIESLYSDRRNTIHTA